MKLFKKRIPLSDIYRCIGESVVKYMEDGFGVGNQALEEANAYLRACYITEVSYKKRLFKHDVVYITCRNPGTVIGSKGILIEKIKETLLKMCFFNEYKKVDVCVLENKFMYELFAPTISWNNYADFYEDPYETDLNNHYFEDKEDAEIESQIKREMETI